VPCIEDGDNEAKIYKEKDKFARTQSRNRTMERGDHPFAINYKEEYSKVQKKEVAPFILSTEDKGNFNKFLDSICKPSRSTVMETRKRNCKSNLTKAHKSYIKTIKLVKPKEDPKHTFEYNW